MTSNQAKIGYVDALKQIIETMNFNADVEKFIEVSQTILMFREAIKKKCAFFMEFFHKTLFRFLGNFESHHQKPNFLF